jgi:hypothetical protein
MIKSGREAGDDGRGNVHRFSHATAYLVTRTDRGLNILWRQGLLIDSEKSESSKGLVEKEIERRMKRRSQAPKG